MKKKNIKERIEKHKIDLKFARITRKVAKDAEEISRGYVLNSSNKFVVIQETEDFELRGFSLFPVKHITDIRYNNHDKYYDKIMKWEGLKKNIGPKTDVDLSSWKSVFKTFQEKQKSIIVECEDPKIDTFTIGEVTKVGDKSVWILYFDAEGFLDDEATELKYNKITKVSFDDKYADVFSQYTRMRKG